MFLKRKSKLFFFKKKKKQKKLTGSIGHTNLGVLLLALELKLDVKQGNLDVLAHLGLHLKACVGKGLLESDTGDQDCVLNEEEEKGKIRSE